MLSFTPRGGALVDDVAGAGHAAGEPVKLGDDQRVTNAAGGESFAQAGAGAVCGVFGIAGGAR